MTKRAFLAIAISLITLVLGSTVAASEHETGASAYATGKAPSSRPVKVGLTFFA